MKTDVDHPQDFFILKILNAGHQRKVNLVNKLVELKTIHIQIKIVNFTLIKLEPKLLS